MIDIVLPYCTDKDKKWRELKDYYLKQEKTTDRQATGEERYRDWDCLKYWFRGVENNCKWVNKVFLIVACESQVPDWLDRNNPKLQIIYHDDYIPKQLLPTFNASTIELFINRIKDVSDNYIYCNDDFFFLNPIASNKFFANDKPIYRDTATRIQKYNEKLLSGSDGTFYKGLNNCMDFQLKISGDRAKSYGIDHLPTPHKKDFEKRIMDMYYDDFIKAQLPSKFRYPTNLSHQIFINLYRDLKEYEIYNLYSNSKYVTLKSDVNFDDYASCDMVCFNDTEQLDNYEITKEKLLEFFNKKFPNKSSFEVRL